MDLMTLPRVNVAHVWHTVDPLRSYGSGPWRILPECPAVMGHNTTKAIRSDGAKHLRCICPRGRQLAKEVAELKAASRARRKERTRLGAKGAQQHRDMAALVEQRMQHFASALNALPDLSGAACATPWGQRISDRAFGSDRGGVRAQEVLAMKKMCRTCPLKVRTDCGVWALQREGDRPGSMGGVYGGMSMNDRKKIRAAMDSGAAAEMFAEILGRVSAR